MFRRRSSAAKANAAAAATVHAAAEPPQTDMSTSAAGGEQDSCLSPDEEAHLLSAAEHLQNAEQAQCSNANNDEGRRRSTKKKFSFLFGTKSQNKKTGNKSQNSKRYDITVETNGTRPRRKSMPTVQMIFGGEKGSKGPDKTAGPCASNKKVDDSSVAKNLQNQERHCASTDVDSELRRRQAEKDIELAMRLQQQEELLNLEPYEVTMERKKARRRRRHSL